MGLFIVEIPSGERILTPANVTFSLSLGSTVAPPEFFEIIRFPGKWGQTMCGHYIRASHFYQPHPV